MTSPGTGVVRLLRSAVLTGLVVALTVLAHRVGGGQSPPIFAILVLTVPLWPFALLATRRRLGPLALVGGLGAGQLLGHGLLSWLGGTASVGPGFLAYPPALGVPAVPAAPIVPASLECLQQAVHHRVGSGCLGAASLVSTGHTHAQAGSGALMLAAHAAATVLAALLIAQGERVLWRVLDLLLPIVPVLLTPLPPGLLPLWAALRAPFGHSVEIPPGRGPPAYAA